MTVPSSLKPYHEFIRLAEAIKAIASAEGASLETKNEMVFQGLVKEIESLGLRIPWPPSYLRGEEYLERFVSNLSDQANEYRACLEAVDAKA